MKPVIIILTILINSVLFAGINEDYLEYIKKNNSTEVSRLLNEGANINFMGNDTKSGLIIAAENGYSRLLLKRNQLYGQLLPGCLSD